MHTHEFMFQFTVGIMVRAVPFLVGPVAFIVSILVNYVKVRADALRRVLSIPLMV